MILQCRFCYLYNSNKQCLPSFVSPPSCTVLFLWCFLLSITACTVAKIGGHTFKRKAPFATTLFKKGGVGLFSRVGLFLGDYSTTNFRIIMYFATPGFFFIVQTDTAFCSILLHISYLSMIFTYQTCIRMIVNFLDHAMK